MCNRKIMNVSLAVLGGLALAGNAFAYEDVWIGAGGDGNWATDANWASPSYPGAHFAPDAGSSVVLTDATTTANVTLFSGSSTINDFTAYANFGPGGNTSFLMKNGSSVHSTHNFDLGYFNGPETVTITIEEGATLDVDGYYGGGRAGPHTSHIYGIVTTDILTTGGSDFIDFGSTGVIITSGDFYGGDPYYGVDLTSHVTAYVNAGLFTAASGYEVVSSFDSNTGQTTISTAAVVPEPVSGVLVMIGVAGLVQRRRHS